MFMVINRITCSTASAAHLERAFAPATNLDGVPGFVGSRLLKNTHDAEPLEYLAMFQWESRAAFEAWRKSESFRRSTPDRAAPGMPVVTTETYETAG